jgi:hypothetical protein
VGINSSCMEIFSALRKREKAHVLDEKSIPASKIENNERLYSTSVPKLGSCSVPSPHDCF